jgi:hypothetical protein
MEWVQKHTFGVWKMVDLDNWLVGNPLVIPKFDVKKHSVAKPAVQTEDAPKESQTSNS